MKEVNLLADTEVLVLDIQASGANPNHGKPLEIGWVGTTASDGGEVLVSDIESYLCQMPEGEEIPRRVSRITGIQNGDMETGVALKKVWKKLMQRVRKIKTKGVSGRCLLVIHFARYEEPFLRHMHEQFSGGQECVPFPFEIFCTHCLAQRLLPGIPRKGLRAVAGYLGLSVPELRRSAHHVHATAFIWMKMVELLAEQNIYSLEQLNTWLEKPIPKPSSLNREFLVEAAQRLKLPPKPGVYRMLRSNGDILYIGKATSLKHRVNSYFQKRKRSSFGRSTLEMLTQAAHLEVSVTGSALEAALLETDEIKKHSPPYNTALRKWERKIVFFSRDLRTISTEVDELHPLGPFPAEYSMPAFAAVIALLRGELEGKRDDEISSAVLGLPAEYLPEFSCFQEGVKVFKIRYGKELDGDHEKTLINRLMALGKKLRQKKLEEIALAKAMAAEEKDNSTEEPEEDEETGEPEERVWSPESVAGMMEGIIRHGAHLVRRSRWYCMLSESALTWTSGKTAGRKRRLLVLYQGKVTRQEDIAPEVPVPLPPGHEIPLADRRKNIDLATYDRLRVLTTELRRLAAKENGKDLKMRLSTKVMLEHKQFIELLKWV